MSRCHPALANSPNPVHTPKELSLALPDDVPHRKPRLSDHLSQTHVGDTKLTHGDGRGAAVDVRPKERLTVLGVQVPHRFFNEQRIERVARWPVIGCVPLPSM